MKKLLNVVVAFIFYGGFLAVFCLIFAALFLGKDFHYFVDGKTQNMHSYNADAGIFRIVFPNEPSSLEPTLIDSITRQRLVDTYETLIVPDTNMNFVSSLALSWGMIDDYTWEFGLRPGVKFHDGSSFEAEDVKASIERAIFYDGSELASFLSGINGLKILDDSTLQITTTNPDPLLIQKISMIFIIPSEYTDKIIEKPIGTGSYKFISWEENIMNFERFNQYWGEKPVFSGVKAYFVPDKSERVQMLIDGNADFLANVPYEAFDVIKSHGFEIQSVPSLEVQFIVFNFTSELMSSLSARKAVSLAIDQNELIKSVGGFARDINQFVPNGIFGFNTDIPEHEYNLDKAKTFAAEYIQEKTLKIHLLKELDVLGEYLRKQLNKIYVHPVISYMDFQGLIKSMSEGGADIYFLAMKSDLGDASSFFNDIAHSGGGFNIGRYSNSVVDNLVSESSHMMDVKKRLEILKNAMKIVVEDDPIGVPLFEYETLYAFKKNIVMEPRIDGFIHYDTLSLNSL